MIKIFLVILTTFVMFVFFNMRVAQPLHFADIIFSSKDTQTKLLDSKSNKYFIINYSPVKIEEINKKLMLCQSLKILVDDKKIDKKICIINQNYIVLDNNSSNKKIKNIDLLKGENILHPSEICKIRYYVNDNIVLLRRDMLKIDCNDSYFFFAFGIGLYEVKYNNKIYKFYRQN